MEVMNMIDLVLVKKNMLLYVQGVRTTNGMEQGFSDHVVMCKDRFMGTGIKRR